MFSSMLAWWCRWVCSVCYEGARSGGDQDIGRFNVQGGQPVSWCWDAIFLLCLHVMEELPSSLFYKAPIYLLGLYELTISPKPHFLTPLLWLQVMASSYGFVKENRIIQTTEMGRVMSVVSLTFFDPLLLRSLDRWIIQNNMTSSTPFPLGFMSSLCSNRRASVP